MKQVKIFSHSDYNKLEKEVNDFLKEIDEDCTLLDVKLTETLTLESGGFSVLVLYKTSTKDSTNHGISYSEWREMNHED